MKPGRVDGRGRGRAILAVLAVLAALLAVAGSAPAVAQAPKCFGKRATIVAEPGVPTVGTDRDDVIVGTAGPDRIRGGGGDDLICGLQGADVIRGNSGDDRINGGGGPDRVYGGKGADEIIGWSGHDELHGNSGADLIRGKKGRDRIWGGKGADTIFGGRHGDVISGNSGGDRLRGGPGADTVSGGKDDDDLDGWSGSDLVSGQSGNDVVRGGSGFDICRGGAGTNTLEACETGGMEFEIIETGMPLSADPAGMGSVTAFEGGFVAVGTRCSSGLPGCERGELWFSPDGRAWQKVDDPDFDGATFSDVVAGGPGVVMVGGRPGSGAVWLSADGLEWDPVKDPSLRRAGMGRVTAWEGGLAGVDMRRRSTSRVWLSEDGQDWEMHPNETVDDVGGSGMTGGGPGLVFVGEGDSVPWPYELPFPFDPNFRVKKPGAVVSEDGLEWVRVRDRSLTGPPTTEGWLDDVVAAGPGLVAVGPWFTYEGKVPVDPEVRVAFWLSRDGFDWQRHTVKKPNIIAGLGSLAPYQDGVIAVGGEIDERERCLPGREQLPACRGWYGIWWSPDGLSWHRFSVPAPPDPRVDLELGNLVDVAAGEAGVVALTNSGTVLFGGFTPLD